MRTAEHGADEGLVLSWVDLQLRIPQDGIGAHIDEGSNGDRSRDGDAVFEVTAQTEVAAGGNQLVVGHRNIPAIADAGTVGTRLHRETRVGGDKGSVTISEGDALSARQVGDGRNGADIEAADVVFAAEIGAFKGRSDDAS